MVRQKRSIQILSRHRKHPISEHTIEEKILWLHQSKRSLADSLLEGTSLSGKLSVKELLEMIAA